MYYSELVTCNTNTEALWLYLELHLLEDEQKVSVDKGKGISTTNPVHWVPQYEPQSPTFELNIPKHID